MAKAAVKVALQAPARPARKRRPPRKKAVNREQAEQQLARFERLLNDWIGKMTAAAGQVAKYHKKTAYYQQRVTSLLDAERAAMEAAVTAATAGMGRTPRVIDLGGSS